ncbi:MAG: M48 family metallopeptidase [bacterium]
MSTLTLVFLAFLAVSTALQFWLSWRQIRTVQAHRSQVPDAFAAQINLEAHQKAADYTVSKERFGQIEAMIGLVVLLFWTLGGGLQWLDESFRGFVWGELLTGAVVIISVSMISSVIDLPASLYRTFVLEERFGFNQSTPKVFFIDLLKTLLLSLLLGVPLIMLILWLMESAGTYWWIYAWVFLTAFSLLMMWAYPKFIAPLFNKFQPLEDDAVKVKVEALLERTGFSSKGVFVMDGSRRSSHGNAYFTGFGKNKRIVFFDTLLKHLTPNQVEAVLAHELGHFKHKHILQQMIMSFTMSLLGLAVLAWLMQQTWFYQGLGVEQSSTYMALILFMLVSPVFTFFIAPIMSLLSRKNEFEADAFAAKESSADELISALVSLYKENASTLTPDALYSAFYDSHPPASIRITHLQQG